MKHTHCPKCESKDNLAVYDDGSCHCFGCGYPCHKIYREITPEEIAKEKQDREAYQREEFERIGNEYGWKYERK